MLNASLMMSMGVVQRMSNVAEGGGETHKKLFLCVHSSGARSCYKLVIQYGSWLPALYFCVTAVRRDTTFTCGLVVIPLSDT